MAAAPQNYKQVVVVRMGSPGQATVVCPPKEPSAFPQAQKPKDTSTLKPPKPPDKPLLPYVRFSRTVYERVKSENPDLKLWEIGKIIGQMWRDLPEDEKAEYVDKYKIEKIDYEKNYKTYLASPAYLAYAAAKAKGETQAAQAVVTGGQKPGAEVRVPTERKAFIESVEDEEDVEDAYHKHMVACARYSRNYRLIEDIFSEAVVPSEPPLYTAARIEAYRGHVKALTDYVAQLQTDIIDIEAKFEQKKRKIAEAAEAFEREMKRLRSK